MIQFINFRPCICSLWVTNAVELEVQLEKYMSKNTLTFRSPARLAHYVWDFGYKRMHFYPRIIISRWRALHAKMSSNSRWAMPQSWRRFFLISYQKEMSQWRRKRWCLPRLLLVRSRITVSIARIFWSCRVFGKKEEISRFKTKRLLKLMFRDI